MVVSIGYSNSEVIFILIFYFIGGILGYFAFRHQYDGKILKMIGNCILTTMIGVFLAYIFANYLEENKIFSKQMNMLIGGLGSFGFPDLIITYFPSLKKLLADYILKKLNIKKEITDGATK